MDGKEVAMPKVLIVYYSRTGNTEKMAGYIAEGVKEEGVEVEVKRAEEAKPEDLLEADGVVMGSPTYYGTMAAELKKLLDDSVKYHGRLDGKVGGAFASSAQVGGGNETTVLDIVDALLIHGMVVQGDPQGDHYGPVSIGAPDGKVEEECRRRGRRIAQLVKKLAG